MKSAIGSRSGFSELPFHSPFLPDGDSSEAFLLLSDTERERERKGREEEGDRFVYGNLYFACFLSSITKENYEKGKSDCNLLIFHG